MARSLSRGSHPHQERIKDVGGARSDGLIAVNRAFCCRDAECSCSLHATLGPRFVGPAVGTLIRLAWPSSTAKHSNRGFHMFCAFVLLLPLLPFPVFSFLSETLSPEPLSPVPPPPPHPHPFPACPHRLAFNGTAEVVYNSPRLLSLCSEVLHGRAMGLY